MHGAAREVEEVAQEGPDRRDGGDYEAELEFEA